jgi:hypothetical protein
MQVVCLSRNVARIVPVGVLVADASVLGMESSSDGVFEATAAARRSDDKLRS